MPRRLLALALLALLACGLAAAKEAAPGDQLDGGQPLGEAFPASQCQGGGGRLGGVRVCVAAPLRCAQGAGHCSV